MGRRGTPGSNRSIRAERIAADVGIETLLTTRALLRLKADTTLVDAHLAGTASDRAAILRQLSEREPAVGRRLQPLHARPRVNDPVRRLCRLVAAVPNIDVFAINPGPIRPGSWQRGAYKGGSEAGVLNLTVVTLIGKDGRTHCLSVMLNESKPIDEIAATGLFSRAAAQTATAN